jgi:molecular chaperone DnaK
MRIQRRNIMASKRVYGIDLGTTYSCIAHVDQFGQPTIINNSENQATTPSVVYFESEDNIVVGSTAKEVASLYEEQVVSTVKRVMGNPNVRYEFFEKEYTPQEISSFILRKLVEDAEQNIGEKIEDVVITCPAYFGVNQKEATKQAGELAGLNPLYIIPEPTAAAVLYGLQQDPGQTALQEETVLVYDLGGGTFDITLIKVEGSAINVISTDGDDQLGGKNWDDAVVEYFATCFEEETGESAKELTSDGEVYQDFLNLAEQCKIALSSRQSWLKNLTAQGHSVRVELTRDKFNELTASYLERTISLTHEMIDRAKEMGHPNIDKLLLVGGSTYMPQVQDRLKSEFPFEVRLFEPNLAVAKGAALFGHKCHIDEEIKIRISEQTGMDAEAINLEEVSNEVKEAAHKRVASDLGYTLGGVQEISKMPPPGNVASKSIGLVVMSETGEEVVDNLVVKDDRVPCQGTRKYGTYEDNQTSVLFKLMENKQRTMPGEAVSVEMCKEVETAEMQFETPMPKGSPIEVIFDLGPDGRLTVDGKDLTTNKQIHIEVEAEGILTEAEMQEAKSSALAKTVSG